jgi:ABC-type sugar transport system permease subunit
MKGAPKIISILLLVAAAVVVIAGIVTWGVITNNLTAERITVSDDASCAAGDSVNGPISAFCMAEVIDHHALEATGGKTYAELDQDDPLRATAMNASFLRASLFTSVVAYGVAAFAVGMGIVLALLGVAVRELDRRTAGAPTEVRAAETT